MQVMNKRGMQHHEIIIGWNQSDEIKHLAGSFTYVSDAH